MGACTRAFGYARTQVLLPYQSLLSAGGERPVTHPVPLMWTELWDSFELFRGGPAVEQMGQILSITVVPGRTATVLYVKCTVLDFPTLREPLCQHDLVVVDLLSHGDLWSMDVHESPVTCYTYLADCPAGL
ncbi:hypothetical protein O3P69_017666 [Scylla paramamosain]|uniref:Uncharacterized protein n=1 Tax=Scylla paramamosain TaxID=85552 RepID=A0AAW0TX43_SCYPA